MQICRITDHPRSNSAFISVSRSIHKCLWNAVSVCLISNTKRKISRSLAKTQVNFTFQRSGSFHKKSMNSCDSTRRKLRKDFGTKKSLLFTSEEKTYLSLWTCEFSRTKRCCSLKVWLSVRSRTANKPLCRREHPLSTSLSLIPHWKQL